MTYGRTGELDCVLCNLAVSFWKGLQHMQHVHFIKHIAAIPDQCIRVAFSDEIPGCPKAARIMNGFKVFCLFVCCLTFFWPVFNSLG